MTNLEPAAIRFKCNSEFSWKLTTLAAECSVNPKLQKFITVLQADKQGVQVG